jgi:hypothetical protein
MNIRRCVDNPQSLYRRLRRDVRALYERFREQHRNWGPDQIADPLGGLGPAHEAVQHRGAVPAGMDVKLEAPPAQRAVGVEHDTLAPNAHPERREPRCHVRGRVVVRVAARGQGTASIAIIMGGIGTPCRTEPLTKVNRCLAGVRKSFLAPRPGSGPAGVPALRAAPVGDRRRRGDGRDAGTCAIARAAARALRGSNAPLKALFPAGGLALAGGGPLGGAADLLGSLWDALWGDLSEPAATAAFRTQSWRTPCSRVRRSPRRRRRSRWPAAATPWRRPARRSPRAARCSTPRRPRRRPTLPPEIAAAPAADTPPLPIVPARQSRRPRSPRRRSNRRWIRSRPRRCPPVARLVDAKAGRLDGR